MKPKKASPPNKTLPTSGKGGAANAQKSGTPQPPKPWRPPPASAKSNNLSKIPK